MRFHHASRATPRRYTATATIAVVFVAVCVPARQSAAQTPSACVARVGASARAALPDGRTVTASTHNIESDRDTILVVGTPTRTWDPSRDPAATDARNRGLIGFRRTPDGHISLVRAPNGHESARGIHLTRAGHGWDVVFFRPDSLDPGAPGQGENGTLWFARLEGSRWSDVHLIMQMRRAEIRIEVSSRLLRHRGALYLALGYKSNDGAGGVMLIQREAAGAWRVDSIPLPLSPIYVTAVQPRQTDQGIEVFFVASTFEGQRLLTGPLWSTRFPGPTSGPTSRPRIVVRTGDVSMVAPRVHWVGPRLVATWWEQGTKRGEPSRLFSTVVGSGAESDSLARQLVASGTNSFVTVPITVGRSPALLWLYRPGMSSTEVGAALLLDGQVLQLPALGVANQGFLGAAASGGGAADLVTARLPTPTPGTAERPATLITRVTIECARGQ